VECASPVNCEDPALPRVSQMCVSRGARGRRIARDLGLARWRVMWRAGSAWSA
jgi:hypothetical protein